MEVYLVRHTTPDIEKDIIYGQLDIDVTSTFDIEATAVRQKLPPDIDILYSSPLLRCKKLAQFISAESIREDQRLLEFSFGDWEGKKWNDIDSKELDNWMKNYITTAPPNGESMEQMMDRVHNFWEELLALNHSSVVITTHAGVIRLIFSIVSGTDLKDVFDLQIEYGDVFEIDTTLKKWKAID